MVQVHKLKRDVNKSIKKACLALRPGESIYFSMYYSKILNLGTVTVYLGANSKGLLIKGGPGLKLQVEETLDNGINSYAVF